MAVINILDQVCFQNLVFVYVELIPFFRFFISLFYDQLACFFNNFFNDTGRYTRLPVY